MVLLLRLIMMMTPRMLLPVSAYGGLDSVKGCHALKFCILTGRAVIQQLNHIRDGGFVLPLVQFGKWDEVGGNEMRGKGERGRNNVR
jgi:hypothetical protein